MEARSEINRPIKICGVILAFRAPASSLSLHSCLLSRTVSIPIGEKKSSVLHCYIWCHSDNKSIQKL
ncbi:hypothetical protein K1719_040797 [Acacia pycnantha]|nr:hypothetical protein K1719_040797 [Acacia pycnantha]